MVVGETEELRYPTMCVNVWRCHAPSFPPVRCLSGVRQVVKSSIFPTYREQAVNETTMMLHKLKLQSLSAPASGVTLYVNTRILGRVGPDQVVSGRITV